MAYTSKEETVTHPTWTTLEIGSKSFRELMRTESEVSMWARVMMSDPAFTILPEPITVELIRVKVQDFGFTSNPTTDEIFDSSRLTRFGLDLCPPEVGPHLVNTNLIDLGLSCGEGLVVAMERINNSIGAPSIFKVGVRRETGRNNVSWTSRWIGSAWVGSNSQWDLDIPIVFIRRKP